MERPLCSLLLIVNKEPVYRAFLESLKTQKGVCYEVIPIWNQNGEFSGARQAFAYGLKEAKGEYLVFCHPDLEFTEEDTLANILQHTEKLGDFGVVGVAGTPEKLKNGDRVILSGIVHGAEKKSAGQKIQEPVPVQTVDECLFIIKAETLKKIPFSQRQGWHLYAVEYCLQMLLAGKKNYVVPAQLWHKSDGKSLDWHYMEQLEDVIGDYGNAFSTINTTVKKWPTRGLKNKAYRRYYLGKQWLKRKLLQR